MQPLIPPSELPESRTTRPVVPFRQFVLKVHSRCDLACDHCYVYRHADQGWRSQPMVMSADTANGIAWRIAEHAQENRLTDISVVLHGGEPLLAGSHRLSEIASALRAALKSACRLDLRIHTNAVLLDDAFCEMFAKHGIMVGVSLDGDQRANDLHRTYADGRSSYDRVIRSINLLRSPRYRHLYSGILCTIDVRNDPLSVYETLLDLNPPSIDFLLPHATFERLPLRSGSDTAEYADWLIAIYSLWSQRGDPVRIRTFDSILRTSAGFDSTTEALGLSQSDLIVIETDGSYEQADSLKAAFDKAAATGFDYRHSSFSTAASHPGFTARRRGLNGLCQQCRGCPVVSSCGGGLYAHRWSLANHFDNPSVYCPDLMKLITHIRAEANQITSGQETGISRESKRPSVRPTNHGLRSETFDALACGYGGADALSQLIVAQRSIRRTLLVATRRAIRDSLPDKKTADQLDAAWDVIQQADARNPGKLDDVLSHPYFRVWTVQCLQDLGTGGPEEHGNASLAGQATGRLASIAAVIALQVGISAKLTVPVRNDLLYLPSLGGIRVDFPHHPDGVAIEIAGDEDFTVVAGSHRWNAGSQESSAQWLPVRRLAAAEIVVCLEDIDPYRDCHQWPAASRLDDIQVTEWRSMFLEAWRIIKEDHGEYAEAMAAGLTTVTPLSAPATDRAVSATARHAFGAVGIALPSDPVILALLLLHEFQHVKLGGILDIYDLYDKDDGRLFNAPWREDPRPLEGLLQGAYAHITVTDFWRTRRNIDNGTAAIAADQHFNQWHPLTAAAIETLTASGSLTEHGHRFVAGMRRSISSWGTTTSTPVTGTSSGGGSA